MTIAISGTTGITLDGQFNSASSMGFKNRIINGAMVIDQRNAGASGTNNDTYVVDRWAYFGSQASKATWQQNAGAVTPPTGFSNYFGFTSSSAYSVGATELFVFSQKIEGFNTSDLGFGTANAQTVTLSFWVRSSLTGTFGGYVANSAQNRNYPFSYTISAANTWEQKSVTIAGDTTGTWIGGTNGIGMRVSFSLGVGSTNSTTANAWNGTTNAVGVTGATSVVGTNGATFYITGVQLEKGSTATSFDYRPYGTELALCQRYFVKTNTSNIQRCGGLWGTTYTSTAGHLTGLLPVPMRTAPTVSAGGTSNTFYMSNVNATSAGTFGTFSTSELTIDAEVSSMSASSTGHPIQYNGQLSITSEL